VAVSKFVAPLSKMIPASYIVGLM